MEENVVRKNTRGKRAGTSAVDEIVEKKVLEDVEMAVKSLNDYKEAVEVINEVQGTPEEISEILDEVDEDFEDFKEFYETAPKPDLESELESDPSNIVEGKVVNCQKLRIRKNPNLKAEVVYHLNEGEVVYINKEDSTDSFYRVIKNVNIDGFCLKTFIKII